MLIIVKLVTRRVFAFTLVNIITVSRTNMSSFVQKFRQSRWGSFQRLACAMLSSPRNFAGFDSRVGLLKLSPNLHFHKFIWAVASLPRCDFYLKRMEVDLDMIGLGAEREWWCISQYALHIMQSCSIFNLHMHTTSCCRCLHLKTLKCVSGQGMFLGMKQRLVF